ncbi:hypothetical protein M9H77_04207 [Catharanthus roseus]|uniref:Uncharacterized protein n=1 Tax=Catharanthus roseus TaxID=4058 RepID=A0ACC0CDX0_CATRO|nr:hypothetical protein M9H77_04207 [Catharanthus roseus]
MSLLGQSSSVHADITIYLNASIMRILAAYFASGTVVGFTHVTGVMHSEGSGVWIAPSGRDISSLQASSFYNLPQGQMAFAPAQPGHGTFASTEDTKGSSAHVIGGSDPKARQGFNLFAFTIASPLFY